MHPLGQPAQTMRVSRRFIGFNRQIVFGEIGALVGTPTFPFLAAHVTRNPTVIALSAVIGGLVTSSLFWLAAKLRDEHRNGTARVRNIAGHVALYTPAALATGLVVYQPTLYYVTRHLVLDGHSEVLAACVGQSAAFGLFLIAINLCRAVLYRFTGRNL